MDPRAKLSPEKRALLERRLRGAGVAADRIGRRDPGPAPASFAQQRLWFLQELDPSSSVSNISSALRVRAAVDPEPLRRALQELIRRHEVLRTSYLSLPGRTPDMEVAQIVATEAAIELPLVDLSGLPGEEREGRALELAGALGREPFDLSRAPMLRASLLRLAPEDHVLALVGHHIALDGWSIGILFRELSHLYRELAAGRPPGLAEPSLQYADFAVWQRRTLAGEKLSRLTDYWTRRLSGMPAVLELPADRPRPARQTFRGARHLFTLPEGLNQAVKDFSRAQGVTPFTTLVACFQLLLARLSGQKDLVVGTSVAGRTRPELEELVGVFVNTVALRADLSGRPSFERLLAQARQASMEAIEHQELPFERIVEELQPERSLSHAPIFQALFNYVAAPPPPLELAGARCELFEIDAAATDLDLSVSLEESGGALSGAIEYGADLFEAETVARMAGHYRALLESALAGPRACVWDLPLLTAPERSRLLGAWAGSAEAFPESSTLHRLFEEQAARTPRAVAAIAGDAEITYEELNARANRLARALRRRGIGPERRVAHCVAPSLDSLVAILGVLKAGGAYLPVDLEAPRQRRELILRTAGVDLVIADAARLADLEGWPTFCLAEEAAALAGESAEDLEDQATAGGLAYLVFTSGSTGEPKGVMVEHRAVVNHSLAVARRFELGNGQRMLHFTPLHFDAAVEEIFPPLFSGATVVVVGDLVPPADFRALIERYRLEVLSLPPSYLHEVLLHLQRVRGDLPACLRLVILGGEQIRPATFELWAELGGARVPWLNVYGPTEATVTTTLCELRVDRWQPGEVLPIGRPIANKRVYVVDESLQPVPQGVPGELCIGGVGLARGYVGRPELTAERFIPNPFSEEPGARLYRTGDQVRWLGGGEIEFLGRLDHQVKIRGFRVELGEVEAALGKAGGVAQAVVVARDRSPGDKRLVAYLVAAGDPPAPGALRAALEERLPHYMVPSAFMFLDALPLTANGKIDQRALPPPEWEQLERAYEPPRGEVEEALAAIWQEVLGVTRVGRADDFFELGGHSLLATQAISRIRDAFRIEVPLKALFDAPSIGALAAVVEAGRGGAAAPEDGAPPLVPAARDGQLPLSFAQQRLWFVAQLEPESAGHVIPQGLRLRGRLDAPALQRALTEIARRHEALRTTYEHSGGRPFQVIHPPALVPLPLEDLGALPEAEREERAKAMALAEASGPFDLQQGPVMRVRLFRLGGEHHLLMLTLHHIACDAWSLGILMRELSALYEAFRAGRPSPLPEPGLQYADFARWQRQWLDGEVLDGKVAYWREQLRGAPGVLAVPTDRPRPKQRKFIAAHEPISLSPELTRSLEAVARQDGATLFMTVLAGFQAVLGRWARQEDVVVGTPVAGRTRAETEGVFGNFINVLPLRLALSGAPTFHQLVRRARAATLDAFAHQDLPFEKLVEALQPERDLSHAPIVQVMFNLDNGPMPGIDFGGLAGEVVDLERPQAVTDLQLSLYPAGGGLEGIVQYSAELFDPDTIQRLVERLRAFLEAAVRTPDAEVARLPLVPARERERLLAWGAGPAAPVEARCFHHAFEEHARLRPNAVAARLGERWLSYAALNAEASRLARALRRRGIGPEVGAGIWLDRSLEAVVALLAVAKAGGACVPIDAGAPPERVAAILAASSALLLTDGPKKRALGDPPVPALCLDEDRASWAEEPAEDPDPLAGPGNLAYVIHTSGSTGRPKGVAVEHRQLAHYLSGVAARFGFEPDRSYGVISTLAADLGHTTLFSALTLGGCVHLISEERLHDAAALAEELRRWPLDYLKATPSHVRAVGATGHGADVLPRSKLVLGGEGAGWDFVEGLRAQAPRLEIHNHYGPTETTVGVLTHRLEGRGSGGALVPLGRPLANVRAYVVDARMQLAPAGTPGELLVGGPQLSRGYLGRPDLTAERFLPDPFAGDGERLYRTGDLARWLPDGTLEFLGRVDRQVKLRGFRVELEEIEHTLAEHPAVAQAAVLARDLQGGSGRLAAFAVLKAPGAAAAEELVAFLRRTLPEPMVPASLALLESMPLTPNGKLDRARLEALEARPAAAARVPLAPRTPTEAALVALWAPLLGVEQLGVDEDLFDLGAHSLMATEALAAVQDAFGVELPLRAVFDHPTVAGMAEQIDLLRGPGAGPGPRPITPVPRTGPMPLSFIQERLWTLSRDEAMRPAYHVPAAFRARGRLDLPALERGIGELARRHEALRASFPERGGRPAQVLAARWEPRLPVVELGRVSEAEVERAALEELTRPFDVEAGPLFRASAFRLAEDDHVLTFAYHKLVADGWSSGLLMGELAALYLAQRGGPAPDLRPPRLQYADFAHWQRQALTPDLIEAEARRCRELFGPPPEPGPGGYQSAVVEVAIDAAATAGLEALARSERSTLFSVLLAAFQEWWARQSGRREAIGFPATGRTRPGTREVVGPFATQLAIGPARPDGMSVRDLIWSTHERVVAALGRQDVPVEAWAPPVHAPVARAVLSLWAGGPQGALSSEELEIRPMELAIDRSPVDLRLSLEAREGGLRGFIEYRTALFDPAAAARVARSVEAWLSRLAGEPDAPVGDLPLEPGR